MIVLRHIGLVTGQIEVMNLGKKVLNWSAEIERLARVAWPLGFSSIETFSGKETGRAHHRMENTANPSVEKAMSSTTTASQVDLIEHKWSLENLHPVYDGTLEHSIESLPQLARYSTVVLATYGPQQIHLMQLQLAVYEICANVLEHGLRHRPRSTIAVHLHFKEGEIHGWVQDSCAPFDPSRAPSDLGATRSLERRNRGYGIYIMRQLLTSLHYEFNGTGNRVMFSKRILR